MNDQDRQRYDREQERIVNDMDAACVRLEPPRCRNHR
jgi:hypothetical protein